MRSTRAQAFFAIGLACAVVGALFPVFVTPHFREVFVGFGADLPLITRVFVHYHFVFWLLPAIVIGAWLYRPDPERSGIAPMLIGSIGLVFIVPATIGAMYLPIFKLAATM